MKSTYCVKKIENYYIRYINVIKIKKVNIFSVLSIQDNSPIVEKTVNFKLNNS